MHPWGGGGGGCATKGGIKWSKSVGRRCVLDNVRHMQSSAKVARETGEGGKVFFKHMTITHHGTCHMAKNAAFSPSFTFSAFAIVCRCVFGVFAFCFWCCVHPLRPRGMTPTQDYAISVLPKFTCGVCWAQRWLGPCRFIMCHGNEMLGHGQGQRTTTSEPCPPKRGFSGNNPHAFQGGCPRASPPTRDGPGPREVMPPEHVPSWACPRNRHLQPLLISKFHSTVAALLRGACPGAVPPVWSCASTR